jgi:ankyrin repeat protein
VKEGQLPRVKYLIDRGADIDYEEDGATLLFQAVDHERVEVVKTLILAGADVNRKTNFGYQAIHTAASVTGDEAFAILELLLWAGCELEKKNPNGSTPLHMAKSGRVAKALIQGGADIESRVSSLSCFPWNGLTPLHEHARKGRIEIAEILIQAGADVNARCDKGKTPLGWCLELTGAPFWDSVEAQSTIALLRAHGATE